MIETKKEYTWEYKGFKYISKINNNDTCSATLDKEQYDKLPHFVFKRQDATDIIPDYYKAKHIKAFYAPKLLIGFGVDVETVGKDIKAQLDNYLIIHEAEDYSDLITKDYDELEKKYNILVAAEKIKYSVLGLYYGHPFE